MNIVFVVNTLGLTGGIKVILEYSNRLNQRGHNVTIVHLLRLDDSLRNTFLSYFKYFKCLLLKIFNYDQPRWFNLEKGIRTKRLINYKKIPKSDAIIATANETADWVAKLPDDYGKKFYFIQDYENWTRDEILVDATYKLPLKRIAVSNNLADKISLKFHVNFSGIVKNGIDTSLLDCGRSQYNNKKILMQYHILPKKGVGMGLEIFRDAKKIFPDIELLMYGAYNPPKTILRECQFYFKPDPNIIKQIFCSADIFLFTSLEEGFGLPPMEAMAAGCAVVSFDVGAINEYATDKHDILLVKPGDKDAILKVLLKLLEDKNISGNIAHNALETSRNFGWENSVNKFESILLNK